MKIHPPVLSEHKSIKEGSVFPKEQKVLCDVLQEKLVQVHMFHIIGVLVYSGYHLKKYHRLGVLSNTNSFSQSSWGLEVIHQHAGKFSLW